MKLEHRISNELNRRSFLGQAGIGLGLTALGSLMNPGGGLAKPTGQQWTGVMNPPPLPVKAKRVIFLCMAGGPSHLETFDNKPELAKLHGKPMPESFTNGQQIAQLQAQQSVAPTAAPGAAPTAEQLDAILDLEVTFLLEFAELNKRRNGT